MIEKLCLNEYRDIGGYTMAAFEAIETKVNQLAEAANELERRARLSLDWRTVAEQRLDALEKKLDSLLELHGELDDAEKPAAWFIGYRSGGNRPHRD